MLLIEPAIANLAEAVEEHGPREGAPPLALVEPVPCPEPQIDVLEPVEDEQTPLDPAETCGRGAARRPPSSVGGNGGGGRSPARRRAPRGYVNAFGVRLAMKTRNPRLVQRMMGHASLETTAIYMDVVGQEARDEMALTW